MSAPFLIYKELSPTSSVRLSIFFTPVTYISNDKLSQLDHPGQSQSQGKEYLFVAAVSAVSIYQVHRRCSNSSDIDSTSTPYLSLVYHSTLFGTTRDVQVYSPPSASDESRFQYLLLSLDDGKFCVVYYDEEKAELRTMAMFNAQEGAYGTGAVIKASKHGQIYAGAGIAPYVSCDDQHGIGCSALYGSQLFFFPLSSASSLTSPYLVDFFMKVELLGTIIDSCFLPDASVPTIVVLQEKYMLPSGHAKAHLHTFTITALTVDPVKRAVTVLWRHEQLPHDSIRLLAMPGSPRGDSSVLVVSMNALLLVSAEGVQGIAFNGFAATTVAPHIFLQNWPFTIGIELDGSHWAALKNRGQAIACLKDGQVVNIQLQDFVPGVDDIRSVRFEAKFLCRTHRCSAVATNANSDLWWFGSRDSICSLVHVNQSSIIERSSEQAVGRSSGATKAASVLDIASTVLGGVELEINAVTGKVVVKNATYVAMATQNGDASEGKGKENGTVEELEAETVEKVPLPAAKKARKGTKEKKEKVVADVVKVESGPVLVSASGAASNSNEKKHIIAETLIAEEQSLYGNDLSSLALLHAQNSCLVHGSWVLTLVDTVNVLGPILGATFCKIDDTFDRSRQTLDWDRIDRPRGKATSSSAASYITEREIKDGVQLSSGLDEQGSLVRVSQGKRFTKVAARTFTGITGILSVNPQGTDYTLLLLSGLRSRLLLQKGMAKTQSTSTSSSSGIYASAGVVGTSKGHTSVVECTIHVSEPKMDSTGLDIDPSLTLAEVAPGYLVQVTSTKINLVAINETTAGFGSCIETFVATDAVENSGLGARVGESLVCADACDGIVAAVGSKGNIFILTAASAKDKEKEQESNFKSKHGTATASAATEGGSCSLSLSPVALKSLLPAGAKPVGVSLFCGYFPYSEPQSADTATPTPNTSVSGINVETAIAATTAAATVTSEQEECFIYGTSLSAMQETGIDPVSASISSASASTATATRTNGAKVSRSRSASTVSIAESEASESTKLKKTKLAAKSKKLAKKQLVEAEAEAEAEAHAAEQAKIDIQSQPMAVEQYAVAATSAPAPVKTAIITQESMCKPGRYALVWCSGGELTVVDIDSHQIIFWSTEIGLMPHSLSVQRFNQNRMSGGASGGASGEEEREGEGDQMASNHATFSSSSICFPSQAHNRGILCAKACSLGRVGCPPELQKLCLTVVLKTGDLVTYLLSGANDGRLTMEIDTISGRACTRRLFVKLSHSCVTRRRHVSTRTGVLESSTDYRLVPVVIGGNSCLAVSGPLPVIIQAEQGAVSVQSLCLPEVQYANAGTMLVTSLIAGDIRGVNTLWQEPRGIASRNQSVLEMYQDAPGSFTLPGSDLSFRRVLVKKTVKASVEFTDRGDDKTEQELLARRTFLLALSEEVQGPFVRNVMSEEMRLEQLKLYERYFEDLSSWCQPDLNIGAPALRVSRRDELVLMQDGEPVSTYKLPPGELICAADVICLSTEKAQLQLNIGMGRPPSHGVGGKRRVFVICSTCKQDPHGEDTPGEGRLLLFSLDYSVFQEDVLADAVPAKDTTSIAITDGITSDVTDKQEEGEREMELDSKDTTAVAVAVVEKVEPPEGFGAMITPKLKIQWTGPGASSVVKGFGEFVIATVDNILYVYKMLPGTMELEQVAFWSATLYIKTVTVIKDRYFAVVDFLHSVQFLVWNQADYSITLLGKDYAKTVGLSTAFLRDGTSAGVLMGDVESNIQVFQYAPHNAESMEGTKLLTLADFHLGADPQIMITHPTISHKSSSMSQPSGKQHHGAAAATSRTANDYSGTFGARMSKASNKDMVIIGTTAGSVGVLVPMEEKVFRRLALLQQLMVTVTPTVCGLNPREYRLMRCAAFKRERKHGLLDGVLLAKYICMESSLQDELAAAMSVDTDLLLETLRELQLAAAVF